jgi:phage terminase small subunit
MKKSVNIESNTIKTSKIVKKDPMELTEKQALFVQHYLANGFKGGEAAIKAGYSENSVDSMASQLLENPKVQARIRAIQKNRMARLSADADWVIRNLIATYKSAKKESDHAGMNRALELIGRAQGMFSDSGAKVDAQVTVNLKFPQKVPIDVAALPEIDPDAE